MLKEVQNSLCLNSAIDQSTDRIAKLSPVKRALLELALKQDQVAFSEAQLIPRRGSSGPAPLSFAQQRLWFLSKLEPDSTAYNQSKAIRLTGTLDLRTLNQALNAIVERHEILRTTLLSPEGEAPIQVVTEPRPLDIPIVDLTGCSEGNLEIELQRYLAKTTKQLFDLSQDLMLRTTLVKLGPAEHVVHLVTHHIASDGWSSGILWQELATLYSAFLRGEPNPLPELPIQYADYAVWQRHWLQGEVLQTQLSYWKEQLSGVSALELPTDWPRPAVQSYRGAKQSFVFPKTLSDQLQALSRKEGVTLFMTLLAALQTLLYRYTGQDDIAVGSPIAGRNRSETDGLIGFFVNTLVLRSDLSGDPTFRELLGRVRKIALEAYEHQDIPFEKLVEELHPERDLSRSPLFQVMFVHQNVPRQIREMPGLIVSPVDLKDETAKFDLSLYTWEENEGLRARLEYNTDLFDAATISRMLDHFDILLQCIVANPDWRISVLSILPEAERHQLLVEWNDTRRDYPKDKCIHELLEAQAEKSPDAVAVVFEDQQLTYRELNARANQLAHYIRNLGVGPQTAVSLCVERSLEMVIGLLAILKAGGAYVPLDPAYPKERLAFMLQDAQVQIVLTQRQLLSELPADHGVQLLCLDTDWAQVAEQTDTNLDNTAKPEDLAYVIYTSGSTGKPKGVQIPHSAVVNFLSSMQCEPGLAANDTLLAVTTLSFDIAGLELYLPLAVGARVVIVSREVAVDGIVLAENIAKSGATMMQATPTTWRMLLETGWQGNDHLKILCGGEALSPEIATQLLTRCSSLWNMYGPTETTIWSSIYRVETPNGPVPIGRPIANTQLYILDRDQQPLPIGVPGELYIGGDGLAQGYLNRGELTDERFVVDPFSPDARQRLYKTGDLARYLLDGNIEFLGRIDHQVKIRGFRIELGEIEAILSQHPAVTETVVVAQEAAPGDKRLVAYAVLSSGQPLDATAARSFLKQKLPEYMVPSAFVVLEKLPLTANGKIDRKSLPAPDHCRPELEEVYVAPRTPVEEMVAQIWAEVLKLNTVAVHDNFFNLGGHSLLATQAISRICEAFKVELPLRALFERPTVAELAKRIEEAHGEEQRLSTRPIVPVSRDKDLPLSFSQQRLWFLDQYEPNSSVYNIPSALRLRGSLNIGVLEQSLNEIIRRHESLRTTFSMVGAEPVQVIAPSLSLSVPVVDLSDHPEGEREEEARCLVSEEAGRPFDLAQGPLFRSKLLRLGEDDHVLLLTMHHIVSDDWSMGVLHREVSMLYQAFVNGESSRLAELSIQYADYAVWQREWLQGEVLDTQLSYWKKRLGEIPGVLDLLTGHRWPALKSHHGARQSFVLSKELTEQLKDLSRKEGVTLFMTLLAGFKAFLYQYTGQTDLVIGSPIAGRNRPGIEGLIGFFVNTLVLRSNLSGNPSFRELLWRVREACLGAYAHQELPYQKLVEALHPKRGTSRGSLAQVFFAFQNVPRQPLTIPGLTVTPVRTDLRNAKGALTLFMWEAEECLAGSFHYAADLFNAADISQMMEHFQTLLNAVVADPERRLFDLPAFLEQSRSELFEAVHWATEQSWHFETDTTAGREQGEI